MTKVITIGYRHEGLTLHQWAYKNTELLAVVLPENRLDDSVSGMVKDWAKWSGAHLLVQRGPDDSTFDWVLKILEPDLILCHCYSYKLSPETLKIPKLGCINIHPGKLPKYKGRDPIKEAVLHGETELGITLHYMNEEFDEGEIIAASTVQLTSNISTKLSNKGMDLLEENWELITKGEKNAK